MDRRGPANNLTIVVDVPRGQIVYYDSTKRFVALCNQHPGCSRERTAMASKNILRFPGQGRPLGFLKAWLDITTLIDNTKVGHCSEIDALNLSHDFRTGARLRLQAIPEAAPLFVCERTKLDYEWSEPEIQP